MKHRNNLTGHWATMVPTEIQSLWLTQVVYSVIIASSSPDTMAYVNYTLDEWIWKAGNNQHFDNTKLTAVDSSKLEDMQEAMRRIIRTYHDNELAMFGSFFFIINSRERSLHL
jgi:hypothetical protein